MKKVWVGLLIALLSHVALAGSEESVRKQVQASMLLTGSIVVAADGSVAKYSVDRGDELPKPVTHLIAENVPTWKFEPVTRDGKPVQVQASMSIRVVAKYLDKDHMTIGISGAQFNQTDGSLGEEISYKDRSVAPHYPKIAQEARVFGTVYLLLLVDRNGQVHDAVAQQVNLGVVDTTMGMERWRKVLGDAALHAARLWTFNTPTTGRHAHDPFWVARVPVNFSLLHQGEKEPDTYGKWDVYVPGPPQPVMWFDKTMYSGAPDAAAGDGLFQLDQGLRMTTPLNGA